MDHFGHAIRHEGLALSSAEMMCVRAGGISFEGWDELAEYVVGKTGCHRCERTFS